MLESNPFRSQLFGRSEPPPLGRVDSLGRCEQETCRTSDLENNRLLQSQSLSLRATKRELAANQALPGRGIGERNLNYRPYPHVVSTT